MTRLTNISPIDGRYAEKTAELASYFGEFALMKYRLMVEIRWLIYLSEEPSVKEISKFDETSKNNLLNLAKNFSENDAQKIKAIENKTHHDLKAVEYFLREFCEQDNSLKSAISFIHFACTSDDMNNVAYAMMVRDGREKLLELMNEFIHSLQKTAKNYADIPMLARTHGQPASPTTLGKEFRIFAERLNLQLDSLKKIKLTAKFNGATGNFNAHMVAYPETDWTTLTKNFIESLGLTYQLYSTQIEAHDTLAEIFHGFLRFNTILIDFSRDMWLYISRDYFIQGSDDHTVGSSTMPHKINPIDFENAEGNLGLANALFEHFANKLPISRLQRDLSDSTVLRNIGVAFAHSLIAYKSLLSGMKKLAVNRPVIEKELDAHWNILTEAIQTVMRRYGHEDAYEQLKALSRGKSIDKTALHKFIQQLDIPKEAKTRLLALTPASYIGLASKLALL